MRPVCDFQTYEFSYEFHSSVACSGTYYYFLIHLSERKGGGFFQKLSYAGHSFSAFFVLVGLPAVVIISGEELPLEV